MALLFELHDEFSMPKQKANQKHIINLLDDMSDAEIEKSLGKRIAQTQKSTNRPKKSKLEQRKTASSGRGVNKRSSGPQRRGSSKVTSRPAIKTKFIIGIDFGTTYSGVSYATNVTSMEDNIQTIKSWPGKPSEHSSKTPSRIAYEADNKSTGKRSAGLSSDAFGFAVKPRHKSYAWFKLLMDSAADISAFDDKLLKSAAGQDIAKTSAKKLPVELTADYLRLMRDHVMKQLILAHGKHLVSSTPMELYITVPAIWVDQAQMNTKDALARSGWLTDNVSKMELVSEPEAAAIAVARQSHLRNTNILQAGMCIITLDLGGGTIDAESMRVVSTQPLKLSIIGIGEGRKVGSTTVDRAFHGFMIKKFGKAFEKISDEKKGPGSHFMNEFEVEKSSFRGKPGDVHRIGFPELCEILELFKMENDNFDKDEKEVVLEMHEMERLFKHPVNEILNLVERQVRKVQDATAALPSVIIILVGGFSRSEYVLNAVREFCGRTYGDQIQLLQPDDPWGAISYGATAYGLDRASIISRVARRDYFLAVSRRFKDGEDDEERAYDCPLHGKRVRGELELLMEKGKEVKERSPIVLKGYVAVTDLSDEGLKTTFNVYSSSAMEVPRWENDTGAIRIGEISIDLQVLKEKWAAKGWTASNLDLKSNPIEVDMTIKVKGGHGAGLFSVQAHVGQKEVGHLVLNY